MFDRDINNLFNRDITNLTEQNKNLQSLVDALKAANKERGEVIDKLVSILDIAEKIEKQDVEKPKNCHRAS
jgi:hypothetical protein